MAIGTPTLVGTSITSGSLTTTANIIAGSLVVLAVSVFNTTVTAVSDGTNSYTQALGTEANSRYGALWYKANAQAVASGATVTITLGTAGKGMAAVMAQTSGFGATPFDTTGAGASNPTSGISNAPSVTTGTLSQTSEIIFGVTSGGQSGAPTYTESANFSPIGNAINTGGNEAYCWLSYDIVSSKVAVTYAPSLSGSITWVATAAPFKGISIIQTNLFGGLIGV